MRVKSIVVVTVLIAAAVIYAQDVADIFNELKTKTVSVPLPAAPAQESVAAPEVKTTPAAVAVEPVAAPEVKAIAMPAAVEPAPAVVEAVTTGGMAVNPVVTAVDNGQNVAATDEQGAIKSGLISLSLKDVELNSVIRLFATLSDANIIVPTLEGSTGSVKVDVNLKNVEWKPALQSILDANSLELYEKTPGSEVYSVRKKSVDEPVAMSVKIFKLDYASVSNVNEMIKTMVPMTGPSAGKISVFPARNTIVVQSTPQTLLDIQNMITAVDLPRQQVVIEAKIMELSDGASKQAGIDWQVLGGDNGGYGVGAKLDGGYGYDSSRVQSRYTDIAGRPYENATATTPTDSLERPGSNPLTDTRVYGITPSVSEVTKTTKALASTLNADDFKVVLAALKQISGTKIVSNPKVMVANEETARIYVGDKEPNIKQETTQAQQADAVTTYNLDPDRPYFEYGVKLDVTPVINTSSNISVKISPSLSRKIGEKTVGNGGTINTFPVISTKDVATVFALENGQTAAIGGLTELDSSDVERKIPVLGSIPLIGRLFSYSNNKKEQRETIIFVTVGLANPVNINMETGLPQGSTLAMRYDATTAADRRINVEEQKLLKQQEAERADESIKKLQNTEQKRLEKKNK